MSNLIREIKMAAREAPRVYFAPLVGAAQEMRRQVRLLAAARQSHRNNQPVDSRTTGIR